MNEIDDFPILLSNAIDKIRVDLGNKNNFIQKIDQISNPSDILKVLLQFLSNDFPIRTLFYNSEHINGFLREIFSITNQSPSDFDLFMKWLPNFIFNKNKTIVSIQKRVSRLQQHIRELLQYITDLNNSGNIQGLNIKEKESKIFSDFDFLEDSENNNQSNTNIIPIPKIDDKSTETNRNNIINNEQLVNLLFQVESLNKRNEQFRIQIENYKIKTDNLVKELSNNKNLNQKISDLETENCKLKKICNQNEAKYQATIISLKQKIKEQDQIIQSKVKSQEEYNKSSADQNHELNQMRFSLENSLKEIENYKSMFNDLSCIFQIQDSNENDLNYSQIQIQSKTLKNKIFQLKEECIKFKIENEKMTQNQNDLLQKVSKLESSLIEVDEENQQLKNELQAFRNLSSSSIYETIDRLRSQNDELKKSFMKITQNKLNTIKESSNNEKVLRSISTSTSSVQPDDINGNSYSSNNSNNSTHFSFSPSPDQSQLAIQEKNNEINILKRRIVSLEAEKIKLTESLKKFRVKKNPEKNILDLKKIGFLLADALSQRYNPSRVPFEINRLIEVVRSEHIKLCESVRVPLDPFDRFTDDPKVNLDENLRTDDNQKKNLFSGFDELDSQISAMKSYV